MAERVSRVRGEFPYEVYLEALRLYVQNHEYLKDDAVVTPELIDNVVYRSARDPITNARQYQGLTWRRSYLHPLIKPADRAAGRDIFALEFTAFVPWLVRAQYDLLVERWPLRGYNAALEAAAQTVPASSTGPNPYVPEPGVSSRVIDGTSSVSARTVSGSVVNLHTRENRRGHHSIGLVHQTDVIQAKNNLYAQVFSTLAIAADTENKTLAERETAVWDVCDIEADIEGNLQRHFNAVTTAPDPTDVPTLRERHVDKIESLAADRIASIMYPGASVANAAQRKAVERITFLAQKAHRRLHRADTANRLSGIYTRAEEDIKAVKVTDLPVWAEVNPTGTTEIERSATEPYDTYTPRSFTHVPNEKTKVAKIRCANADDKERADAAIISAKANHAGFTFEFSLPAESSTSHDVTIYYTNAMAPSPGAFVALLRGATENGTRDLWIKTANAPAPAETTEETSE